MYESLSLGVIFPGQGAQYVGMGKDLYDRERLIQEYFEIASNCVNVNFVKLCFASSDRELIQTINTQTSIFLVSCSIFSILRDNYEIKPDLVAGHSLGQFSALFAAHGINLPDGLYLLKKRSEFLEELTRNQQGGMLSVHGIAEPVLRELIARYDRPPGIESVVEIAYYNSPIDFVLAGTTYELLAIKDDIKKHGGKSKLLKVAGAYHSRMMREAQKRFKLYLEKVDFREIDVPLVDNVDAKKLTSSKELSSSLVSQFTEPVRWWDTLQKFKDLDVLIEIGPGSTNTSLIKSQWPSKQIFSINNQCDIDELMRFLDREASLRLE